MHSIPSQTLASVPCCSARWFLAALCGCLPLSCGLAFRSKITLQQKKKYFSFPALHHLSSSPASYVDCRITAFLLVFVFFSLSFFLLRSFSLSAPSLSTFALVYWLFVLFGALSCWASFEKPIYSAKLGLPTQATHVVCCKWDGFFHGHGQQNCGSHFDAK